MNIPEMALACYYILKAGGFATGGFNFDAKIRRQSIDPDDLLIAHVGSMDACARGLLIAEQMIKDGKLDALRRGSLRRLEGQGGQGHPRRQAVAGRPFRLCAEKEARSAAEERQAGVPRGRLINDLHVELEAAHRLRLQGRKR